MISLSASTEVFCIHLETWFLYPRFLESYESGIEILTLSNSFSTLNVVKEFLSISIVLVGWFNGRITIVWVSASLVQGSTIGVSLGGLPRLSLGLRSYLLFDSAIKNSEKAWYLETYEDSWSSWTWFCCERGIITIWLEEVSMLLISSIIVIVFSSGCCSCISKGVGTSWSLLDLWRICNCEFLLY